MAEMKNLCGKIPVELHIKVRQEIEEREISTQQFIQQVIEEHFTEKGGQVSMAVRTLAVQVSEELFVRFKAAVAKSGCKQKDFLIRIIERAIEEIENEMKPDGAKDEEPENGAGEAEAEEPQEEAEIEESEADRTVEPAEAGIAEELETDEAIGSDESQSAESREETADSIEMESDETELEEIDLAELDELEAKDTEEAETNGAEAWEREDSNPDTESETEAEEVA